MPTPSKRLLAGFAAVFVVVTATALAIAQTPAVPENVASEFAKRLQSYVATRQEPAAAAAAAGERAAPEAVLNRRAALSERAKAARKDAKPGDILFPELIAAITPILRSGSFSITGRQATAMARETDRPPDNVPVPRVNQEFPRDRGLVSPPATILVQLPELPDALEYRLIGPHLVLRDIDTNLIVDVAANVLSAK